MLGGAGRKLIKLTMTTRPTVNLPRGIGPCTRLNKGLDRFVLRGPSILGSTYGRGNNSSRTVRSTSTTGSGVPSQFQTSHHDRGLRLQVDVGHRASDDIVIPVPPRAKDVRDLR